MIAPGASLEESGGSLKGTLSLDHEYIAKKSISNFIVLQPTMDPRSRIAATVGEFPGESGPGG
jgi:hypothetical protein